MLSDLIKLKVLMVELESQCGMTHDDLVNHLPVLLQNGNKGASDYPKENIFNQESLLELIKRHFSKNQENEKNIQTLVDHLQDSQDKIEELTSNLNWLLEQFLLLNQSLTAARSPPSEGHRHKLNVYL